MSHHKNDRYQGHAGHKAQSVESSPQERVSPETLESIINGDVFLLNETAKRLGKYYAEERKSNVSTSQLRGILDHLQRMRPFDPTELQLLRPKLAYMAGRHQGRLLELRDVVDQAIQLVHSEESRFKRLRDFFEAIVAYHRYHGGKK